MMKSSAVLSGSFALTVQFEKLEIHKVFRRFSNFHSCQNLSPITLADFIIGYLSPLTYQFSCQDKKIAPGGTSTESFCKTQIIRRKLLVFGAMRASHPTCSYEVSLNTIAFLPSSVSRLRETREPPSPEGKAWITDCDRRESPEGATPVLRHWFAMTTYLSGFWTH